MDGFMPTMERRRARPRDDGRGRRGRRATTASSRSATGSSCRSPSPAANASSAGAGFSPAASAPTPTTKSRPRQLWGHSPAGLFGYSHLLGGYPGGQAEYLRVPYRRCRADQGADGLQRRAGAVPVRHLPDRLHGGGVLRHPAERHDRDLGLRAGRPVGDQERLPARRRARDRGRHRARAAGAGARCRAPRRSIS